MGIHDRDYIRERPSFGATPSVGGDGWSALLVLVVINVVVFFLWHAFPLEAQHLDGDDPTRTRTVTNPFMLQHFAVSRENLAEGRVHTLLTAAFSHHGLFHLLMNMLFLWAFGRILEAQVIGRKNLIILYGLAGIVGSACQAALMAAPSLGASGAVLGILVVAALTRPDHELPLLFGAHIKLKWLAVCFVVLDLLALDGRHDGVAHFAHLGGALAGFGFWFFDLRPFEPNGDLRIGWMRRLLGVRQRGSAPSGSLRNARVDRRTSMRVEELLDKISREGITALSDEERAFLAGASEKYRSREEPAAVTTTAAPPAPESPASPFPPRPDGNDAGGGSTREDPS